MPCSAEGRLRDPDGGLRESVVFAREDWIYQQFECRQRLSRSGSPSRTLVQRGRSRIRLVESQPAMASHPPASPHLDASQRRYGTKPPLTASHPPPLPSRSTTNQHPAQTAFGDKRRLFTQRPAACSMQFSQRVSGRSGRQAVWVLYINIPPTAPIEPSHRGKGRRCKTAVADPGGVCAMALFFRAHRATMQQARMGRFGAGVFGESWR